jgi:hypothetical protein
MSLLGISARSLPRVRFGENLDLATISRRAESSEDRGNADAIEGMEVQGLAIPAHVKLPEPWADTGTSTGRLMLAVLGGLPDVERDLIRTRTAEGRSRAKERGQPMGRPPSLNTGTAERGHQTPCAGRYVEGIGGQLRPQHINHAPRDPRRVT